MYAIRLIRNPYLPGSGHSVYFYDNEEDFVSARRRLVFNLNFPDLSNKALEDRGYPDYAFLAMKCYRVEEI